MPINPFTEFKKCCYQLVAIGGGAWHTRSNALRKLVWPVEVGRVNWEEQKESSERTILSLSIMVWFGSWQWERGSVRAEKIYSVISSSPHGGWALLPPMRTDPPPMVSSMVQHLCPIWEFLLGTLRKYYLLPKKLTGTRSRMKSNH